MEQQIDQDRWQQIFYMIAELATGNFSVQIPRSNLNDELEAMVVHCNMLAEELKEIFSQYGFLNPRKSFLYMAQMSFHLDPHFAIVNTNQETLQRLNLKLEDLVGKPFKELLDGESQENWEQIEQYLSQPSTTRMSLKVDFPTQHGLHIAAFCFISKMAERKESSFTVTSFQPVLYEDFTFSTEHEAMAEKKETCNRSAFERLFDLPILQNVRDYILENLHESLPKTYELALTFGTNQSKLKDDFREVFGLTPFQFYNKERIRRAKELVENTSIPLKDIAGMTGFNAYPHFSYNYKKEYGHSPNRARQMSD